MKSKPACRAADSLQCLHMFSFELHENYQHI